MLRRRAPAKMGLAQASTDASNVQRNTFSDSAVPRIPAPLELGACACAFTGHVELDLRLLAKRGAQQQGAAGDELPGGC